MERSEVGRLTGVCVSPPPLSVAYVVMMNGLSTPPLQQARGGHAEGTVRAAPVHLPGQVFPGFARRSAPAVFPSQEIPHSLQVVVFPFVHILICFPERLRARPP